MSGFRTDPKNRRCVHPDDVLRVDRQILLMGPVALYGPPERLRQHIGALEDCLGDLDIPNDGGVAIIFWSFDHFARLLPERCWHVLDVIAHAAWSQRLYGRRLLGLVQSDDPDLRFDPVGARPVAWVSWECHKPGSTRTESSVAADRPPE